MNDDYKPTSQYFVEKAVFEAGRKEEDKVNAFPLKYVSQGMELRDYFAARAMQSFIVTDTDWGVNQIAESAYKMADKMMEERDANPWGS